jgi:hypothetical protein
MVWPYWPFSEAFEHAAACVGDVATSVRQAAAAANVALQKVPLHNQVFIFLSSKINFLGPKTSVVPVRAADCRNPAKLAMARA